MIMCDQHNTNANLSDSDIKVVRSLPAVMILVDGNGKPVKPLVDVDPREYVKENPLSAIQKTKRHPNR